MVIMRPQYLILSLTLLVAAVSHAADTMTGIFNPSFKSLQVHLENNPLSPPVMVPGTGDRLVISFDEIAEDRRYMRYSVTHCDARWQPSGLVDSEVVEGFNIGDVDDYQYSQMTLTHYVHYRIVIPNDQMQLKISGNYLLRVYPENDPDDTLLQVRFMVSEQEVGTSATVTSITDIDYNASHQQLSLSIDASRLPVQNLFSDLTVVISQNGRMDSEVLLPHPSRVSGSTAIYEHLPQLIFPAGNEYRRFEASSVTYPGMRVDDITFYDPFYHVTLTTDVPRADGQYVYDQTQHGRFFIREYNSSQSDIEADYVAVHFNLDMPRLRDADIFLDGDFTCRRFDPESLMTYNEATGMYENTMLLKQGAYNYQYLTVPRGAPQGNTATVEGDFYPTVNEYIIKIYYRQPGQRYDRLVGYNIIMSL